MQRTSWIRSSLLAGMLGVTLAAPAGATTPDAWITSATKMRLLVDSQPPALDINVDTWAGAVTLFGIVPSVVASAQQAAVQVRDEELERTVKKAFETRDFKNITVEVKNGVVRLTGTVPSWAWRLEAAAVARAVPGVRMVEDDLRLMIAV